MRWVPFKVRTERELFIGLGVIAAIFLLQAFIDTLLARGAASRAHRLYESSLASIEQVTRMARDIERERILVDDHVAARPGPFMVTIEDRLSQVASDLDEAKRAYEPLTELPNEATLWRSARTSLRAFERGISVALALSRKDRDAEARVRLTQTLNGYAELDAKLNELIEMNRAGVADATHRAQQLQARTTVADRGARITGLLAILVFGWWGTRRVARYETQITLYARELEARNNDLDAFAGRVAHDLRNALAPLVMSPALLRKSAANQARVREIADRMQRSTDRSTGLINALLAFSRANQGPQPDESASVRSVLKDVQDELAPLVSRLDVAFQIDDVPEVDLRCSPDLLHIVLANLCGNAVKYVDSRDRRLVRVSGREDASGCRIEIEDTGPGIPQAALGRIFEPFYRVEGTHAPGTGIGLATVRRILDARGGRIAVESTLGQGSRFFVWLPVVPRKEARTPDTAGEVVRTNQAQSR